MIARGCLAARPADRFILMVVLAGTAWGEYPMEEKARSWVTGDA